MSSEMYGIRALADLGWRLHPLVAQNKVPLLKKWQEYASADLGTVETWARVNEGCNWGIATGKGSGVFVIDIDPRHGGDVSWREITEKHPPIKTATCRTGGGGTHLYFVTPKTVSIRNSSNKIGRGIDVRGEGGQVVVPPSIHPNGEVYAWEEGLAPWETKPVTAPRWLMKLISDDSAPVDEGPRLGDALPAGEKNNNVYHQSLMLARQGADREFVYETMLLWVRKERQDTDEAEIRKTVDSAFKKVEDEAEKRRLSGMPLKNDDDNARKLIADHQDTIMYVRGLGWYTWTGKVWLLDEDSAGVRIKATDTMKRVRDDALEESKDPSVFKAAMAKAQWATQCLNVGRLNSMIDQASKYPQVRRQVEELDNRGTYFLVNFQNGVLNLKTGELQPHDKKKLITKLIPHNYNPDAKCPEWEHTLDLAFAGDSDMIAFMHRALGYSLSGSTSEQCMFICWGENGNNGKSTILEGVQRILGRGYAQMGDVNTITAREKDNNVVSSLAAMMGVRMVGMSEAEESQWFLEGLIKQITGGDTVQVRKLYHEPFNYKPEFKLWIRTNSKPNIRGTDDAIWRRIKLIPFTRAIPIEERKSRDEVDEAIDAEAEGILAWMVRGFQDWMKYGLSEPEPVRDATLNYRMENDVVGQFMEECTQEGTRVFRQQLYATFTQWAKARGYQRPMTSDSFGKKVAKHLNQTVREKYQGKPIWSGIELTEAAQITYYVLE